MHGSLPRVHPRLVRLGTLALSVAAALGSLPVDAQELPARFASIDDGALIPYLDADGQRQTFYAPADKIELSLPPAIDLFCSTYVKQGWKCDYLSSRQEKLTDSDGIGSYTRLIATLKITPSDPNRPPVMQESTLDVVMVRSCPSGSLLTDSRGSRTMDNYARESGLGPTVCQRVDDVPTEKALGAPAGSVGLVCPIPTSPLLGNPINPSTLSKIEVVTDIEAPEGSPLSFVRTYQSGAFPLSSNRPSTAVFYPAPANLGARWRHNFDRQLVPRRAYDAANHRYVSTVYLVSEDGREIRFMPAGGGRYSSESDERGNLTVDGAGWAYTMPDGTVERYDGKGYLVSRRDPTGRTLSLAYRDGPQAGSELLVKVTDWQGRALGMDYDGAGRLIKVVGPDGGQVTYGYDEKLASGLNADLVKATYPDGRFVQYLYDEPAMGGTPAHKLTGIVREDGVRYATFRYDQSNRAESTEHGGGLESTRIFSFGGGILSRTTLDGPEESLFFKTIYGVPRIVKRQESFNLQTIDTKTNYLADGRVDTVTDYLGVPTAYRYDASTGMESERLDAQGTPVARTTRTTWHPVFDLPVRIDRGTAWTTFAYDSAGRLIERTEGGVADQEHPTTGESVSRTTRYAYGSDGLLASIDGPAAGTQDTLRITRYATNAPECASSPATCPWRVGDVSRITDAMGLVTDFLAYDGAGRLLKSRDANGVISERSYDTRGRLVSTTVRAQADGAPSAADIVHRVEYNANGLVQKRTDADGVAITTDYDAAHRPTVEVDGQGRRHELTLNGVGLPVKEVLRDEAGAVEKDVTRTFDSRGELTREKSANADRSYVYDANGRLTERKFDVGAEKYTLDALGRVAVLAYAPIHTTITAAFQYGVSDDLLVVTDPKTLPTSYARNGVGGAIRQSSPDTGLTQRTFDEAGRLIRAIDADGRERVIAYDASGRTSTVTYGDGRVERYTYDTASDDCGSNERFAKGHLSSITSPEGSTTYCYDFGGRVSRKVQTIKGIRLPLAYTYTPAGRLASMTLPDRTVIAYQRNAVGDVQSIRRTTASGTADTVADNLRWTSFGALKEWTAGARRVTRSYDTGGRMIAQNDAVADGLSYTLSWNSSDIIKGLTVGSSSGTYYYDPLGHLTSAFAGASFAMYEYDATGNRTKSQVLSGGGMKDTLYTYAPDSHRLMAVGQQPRTYDAAGNTTKMGTREFAYDGSGRMTQVKVNGVAEMNYTYNPQGQQVARYIAGQTTVALYDEAGHWIGDYDAAGQPLRQIVWLGDQPMAALDGNAINDIQADHLGTPRAVVDRSRNKVIWRWNIMGEVFGADAPQEDPDKDGQSYVLDMRFPGQRYDRYTGLFQNGFRDYDPASGRYVQSDPIGLLGGVSTYSYVKASPMNRMDPLGLDDTVCMYNPAMCGIPTKPADSYVSFGIGGWGNFMGGYGGGEAGVDFDSTGTLCVHLQLCTGLVAALPLQGEVGFSGAIGTGPLCSGTQRSYGAFYTGGAGIVGSAQVMGSSSGASVGRGMIGIGGSPEGAAVGAGGLICEAKYWCTR